MTPERLQQIIELERQSRPWPADATTWMIAARQALRDLLAEANAEKIVPWVPEGTVVAKAGRRHEPIGVVSSTPFVGLREQPKPQVCVPFTD